MQKEISRSEKGMTTNDFEILKGYLPGLVGRVTEMHACFYAKHSGFGQYFESQVATGMAEFVSRLDQPCNNVWVAVQNGRIVGSVSIDGQDLANGEAHLRWFIMGSAWKTENILR